MLLSATDWNRLQDLRSVFLEGKQTSKDYWEDQRLLEIYDLTFGQRIAWKWNAILDELRDRGWKPSSPQTVDWGCGTAVASRAFVERWPQEQIKVWDRSPMAQNFAIKKLGADRASALIAGENFVGTVLLSHILGELKDDVLRRLLGSLAQADTIIWVEPGTKVMGQRLVEIREGLRSHFHLLAPCPHQERCGLLQQGHENDWCHHFAPPPTFIFHDRHWSEFNRRMKIDLRALPLSYLVLEKKGDSLGLPSLPCRLIGRPRFEKALVHWQECSETGVAERRLLKKESPPLFKKMAKDLPFGLAYDSVESLKNSVPAPTLD